MQHSTAVCDRLAFDLWDHYTAKCLTKLRRSRRIHIATHYSAHKVIACLRYELHHMERQKSAVCERAVHSISTTTNALCLATSQHVK